MLDSLERSTGLAPGDWEILVVNNNASDNTPRLINERVGREPLPLRPLFEMRQGKSYALNTALAAVRGEVIAFTDDDIIVPPNWARQIVDYFRMHQDSVCVGGMVQLYDPQDNAASTRTSTIASRVTIKNFEAAFIPIMGCNMAVRTRTLQTIGGFDNDLGPGSRTGGALDLDFLYRIVKAGHAIDYDPEILVFHNHGRRDDQALAQLWRSYLSGRGAFYWKYILQGDTTVARWAYWECARLVGWNWLKALFSKQARRSCKAFALLVRGALLYGSRRGTYSRSSVNA